MPAKIKKVVVPKTKAPKVVTKKKSSTPTSGKKISVKKRSSVKSAPTVTVEEQVIPVVTVIEKESTTTHGPVEVHHKYVFIGACRNCEHMPMRAGEMLGVFSVVILILSGLVLSTIAPLRFSLPDFSMDAISQLIIPDSRVQNL
jgi:hypothetical protein